MLKRNRCASGSNKGLSTTTSSSGRPLPTKPLVRADRPSKTIWKAELIRLFDQRWTLQSAWPRTRRFPLLVAQLCLQQRARFPPQPPVGPSRALRRRVQRLTFRGTQAQTHSGAPSLSRNPCSAVSKVNKARQTRTGALEGGLRHPPPTIRDSPETGWHLRRPCSGLAGSRASERAYRRHRSSQVNRPARTGPHWARLSGHRVFEVLDYRL